MAIYYATEDELRTELGVAEAVLSDAAAAILITDAELFIDLLIGNRGISLPSGRKVVEADVEAYQWTAVNRATVKLAADLYRNPKAYRGAQWKSVSGPDFSVSGPLFAAASSAAEAIAGPLLTSSGLRRAGVMAR